MIRRVSAKGAQCLHARQEVDRAAEDQRRWVRAALLSRNGKTTYASSTTWVSSAKWEVHNATLSVLENDTNAQLSISFEVGGVCHMQGLFRTLTGGSQQLIRPC